MHAEETLQTLRQYETELEGILAWIIHEPTAADVDLSISAALR